MSALADPRFYLVLGVSALATLGLARVAGLVGWGDAPSAETAGRKLQRRAVPTVGGLAILVGLACAPPWGDGLGSLYRSSLHGPDGLFGLLGLATTILAVLVVGGWDDRRPGGLRPLTKLALQALALAPFAGAVFGRLWAESGLAPALAFGGFVVGAGLVALNVVNTFDNADGAVASVAAVAFAASAPWVSAALLGFLPFNLDARLPWNRASRAPTAYLGDSGSHLVGLLILLVPAAWPALWIPALDLARLCVVRLRAGSRPWIGDRRHLAHRLQARGLPPVAVAASLAGLALPGCLGSALAGRVPGALTGGLVLGALAFALTLALTAAPRDA